MDRVTLHHGDCLDVLAGLPDSSVDAVVTDPPYGLGNPDPAYVIKALERWFAGDRAHVPDSKGFMGCAWDAFVPPPAVWDECLRVLKPGGHMLAFAGSRTYDLMTLSIRLAGFEIRDGLSWLYGSGFPKSLDVGKAIDKAAGAEREVIGDKLDRPGYHLRGHDSGTGAFGRGISSTTSETRLAAAQITAPATDAARQWQGFGTALKPAHEPIVMARKPLSGNTVAANVLAHGTGALNIDGCRVAAAPGDYGHPGNDYRRHTATVYGRYEHEVRQVPPHAGGRWPSNVVLTHSPNCAVECSPGCPVAELDAQSGTQTSRQGTRAGASGHNGGIYGVKAAHDRDRGYGDTGGASRFFPVFRYQAKAPTSERPKVNGIAHSTVKPLALMRWLVRLVTPPGGTVLDPFAGSGTTLEAAALEGFHAIGIEREETYLPLIQHRIDRVADDGQLVLTD